MEFGGNMNVKTQVDGQKIWDTFLNDTNILCSVIPGGQSVEKTGDKTYHVVMKQGLGPFKFTFDMEAEITEMRPPEHAVIAGRGQALGGMGDFTMTMTLDLKDKGDGSMDVSYNVNASVGGKLGSFGDRVINAKAKGMEKDIVKSMEKALSGIS